jgi:hypothetical protein
MRTFTVRPGMQSKAAGPGGRSVHPGHHHHRFSRRALLGGAAGVAGGVAAAGMLPGTAFAKPKGTADPKPTTSIVEIGGLDFALTFFGPGLDPASITDFNGFVGVAQVQGTGTATYPDRPPETLLFDTDMRFMSGVYVAQDERVHKGAFAFV